MSGVVTSTEPGPRPTRHRLLAADVGGGVLVAVVAVLLYTRFGLHSQLSRDESIYAYGGQQLLHGVAPYASIVDPKTPLGTFLCGLGAALGKLFGVAELTGIRVLFFLCALAAVVAVYLLALWLWRSVLGAIAAAIVFTSFVRFALDALGGPDAKTPGILVVVLCLWFACRRRWFAAGLTGALAVLDWQPFAGYLLVVLLTALLTGENGRRDVRAFGRCVLGAALPLVATLVYFVAAGAFHDFVESTVLFPATGVRQPPRGFLRHFEVPFVVANGQFGFGAVLIYAGYLAFVVLVVAAVMRAGVRHALRVPVVGVVATSALLQVLYAFYDFQGGPDMFPLLIAPALGLGGAAAYLAARWADARAVRTAAVAVVSAAAVALAAYSWVWFGDVGQRMNSLRAEQSDACAVQRVATPDHPFWSLGSPVPLVLTGRTNPDRYVYLGEGVDHWKVTHTRGGFAAWMRQITQSRPSLVMIYDWHSKIQQSIARFLRAHGFRPRFLGVWPVFVSPSGLRSARAHGVRLTGTRTRTATGLDRRPLPHGCAAPPS